jgi:hypothetical protein
MSRVALKRFLEWMKVCLMTFVSKSEHDVSKNDLVNLTFIFYGDVFVAKTQRNGFVKWRHFWSTERGFHQAGSPPHKFRSFEADVIAYIYIYADFVQRKSTFQKIGRRLFNGYFVGRHWAPKTMWRQPGQVGAELVLLEPVT